MTNLLNWLRLSMAFMSTINSLNSALRISLKIAQHPVQVANASIRTPDNKIILENLNFHVSPGKWLLLKGYSGAKPHCLKHYPTAGRGLKVIFLLLLADWYVSQTPLIKSGLLKEIICKALPLP